MNDSRNVTINRLRSGVPKLDDILGGGWPDYSFNLVVGEPGSARRRWPINPHNYESLSGQLRMPGLPDVAEKEALKGKMNSYGKTWHTWMTGMPEKKADPLPFGPPHLQWSFNKDGEDMSGIVAARDKRFDFSTAEERQNRRDLVALAKPQDGVDAMAGFFPNSKPVQGVTDNGEAATRPVPIFGLKDAHRRRPNDSQPTFPPGSLESWTQAPSLLFFVHGEKPNKSEAKQKIRRQLFIRRRGPAEQSPTSGRRWPGHHRLRQPRGRPSRWQ